MIFRIFLSSADLKIRLTTVYQDQVTITTMILKLDTNLQVQRLILKQRDKI